MKLSRRSALGGFAALLASSTRALAFGDASAFNPRLLAAGGAELGAERAQAPGRWSWELVRRTSAPGRQLSTRVGADQPALLTEPFVLWAGSKDLAPLSAPELRGLEKFLKQGGLILVDDLDPEKGAFGKAARRELHRALPDSAPVKLDAGHVIYKSYYLIDRPVGRVLGPPFVEAIVRGKYAQVIFLSHDLMGALARSTAGTWSLEVEPGGPEQREQAVRFAINLAMYVLCSDYKDDQVHAPWIMRRRAKRRP